jgi:ABC-type cobalamin/Fe3+-siderophores transport system ATPase subunit
MIRHDFIEHLETLHLHLWRYQNGRIVADGSPREVLTAALLAEVFQVQRTLSAIPWITSLSVCPTR